MAFVKKFKIPQSNEDPSKELIDFLNSLKQDWSGDEGGIVFCFGEDGDSSQTGFPGDWIVFCEELGVAAILKEDAQI